jgi:hypothetical protein
MSATVRPKHAFIRDFRKRKIDEPVDIVCDVCNHGWMSVLTDQSKTLIDPLGRHERPTTIITTGIVTLAAFAFMKAIVIDHSQSKRPHISPAICARFRHSLLSGNPHSAIPSGLQMWLARYRRKHAMELYAFVDALQFNSGAFKGYSVLSITYLVGALAFHITFPKWTKHGRKRPPHAVHHTNVVIG